jgi:hypothetical protein
MMRALRTTKQRKKHSAKQMKKKPVRPSTTRSTAGPGFDFEDQVAAWLLLKALTGQPLPGVEGIGTRLQMQTEALGWAIDDILFTTVVAPADFRHLAISCKSNVQVTASGMPADFVKRCWQQWAKAGTNPMQRGKDCLMLVTRGKSNAFMAAWSYLKNAAPGADLALALGRIRATAKHRMIFDSVKAPAKDVGVTARNADVVAIINGIEVAPVDFQLANSENKKLVIKEARSLLVNSSLVEGKRLWTELVTHAKNTRLGSGTLDIPDLWRRLRGEFVLKDHPDFEASWQELRALTRDYKATIETALPSGVSLDRKSEIDKLVAAMSFDAVCVVFGESGSGKSALVKSMLDERFPKATQVWFGPDNFDLALNEATRAGLRIDQPLIDVLDATSRVENFLVIDAAERLGHGCALKAKALIEELKRRNASGAKTGWRVLIIGQTEAWVGGKLQDLAGETLPKNLEMEGLLEASVRDVLRSVAGLGWLATHADAVAALTNLRTLAWVIQAAARFHGRDGSVELSLTTIADRLWSHWTDNKPSVQRLLVRLAEREAAFEHSFAVSQLESGDATVLDDLPIACPLRRDKTSGRIQFQHDLAADWARFQRLKEIAGDTAQWTPLAANPFWHGALRMLGQLLLRQQVESRCAWDVAFEVAERDRDATPLADDVLLDSLFLDPNAEAFLDARADMLFANNGARLLRLVKRFEHVASVPGVSIDMQGRFRDLSLFIEAHFRTPIFGRWPAMARFLAKHRDHIAKMMSPAIASLCDRWLTSTPSVLSNGTSMPFRREFADLALANARETQLAHAKGVMFIGESETRIYQAAFAGAPDLPVDVSEWALELAQRRPYRADVIEQVRVHRAEKAAEHVRRLETDPDYREHHERRQHFATPISSGRKLPPWPLGAQRRIEGRYRDAVLRSPGFQALMRTNAAVAGEVLLACIIEDEPREEFGSSRGVDRELGIEFDNEGYPTAPWKSPFYAFLQINSDAAFDCLNQLINFSTERWVTAVRKQNHSDPPTLSLRLADGTVRAYSGNYWVFTWSQHNSLFIGQLHCALAALERWLCDQIDAGIDVARQVDTLLRATNSVAVLGVLVNVGKYRAELLKGSLRPLLGTQLIYEWDSQRCAENTYSFDAMAWVRSGEIVFEMAKTWVLASYKKRQLREIVPTIAVADSAIADFILAATSQWTSPKTEKEALEFRILIAELDYRNYPAIVDPATGKQTFAFAYPHDVAAAISKFDQDKLRLKQALLFPGKCRDFLKQSRMLSPPEAEWVAALMAALDGAEEIDIEEEMTRAPRVAAAAVLLLRAPDWLAEHAAVQQRAQLIIDNALAGISHESEARSRRILMAPSHLEFAAYLAVERWIAEPSKQNDETVLLLLTSGDEAAVQVVVWLAYRNRETLGRRWWRLLYFALLWSGLLMLTPRFGDEEGEEVRWQRWSRWIRSRSLSAKSAAVESINPLAIAERVERFEFERWQRRYARDGRHFVMESGRRLSGSLQTHFLQSAFAWLFRNQGSRLIPAQELEIHRRLVASFWAHQAWWQSGSGKDENDDYKPMPEFGYTILDELARLIVESPADAAPAMWRPVFELGPKGHYAIGHFLTCWFNQITETTVIADFAQRWRHMIEFMLLDEKWAKGGPWYYGQQLERQVLGFNASDYLKRYPDHATLIAMMCDLFEVWAKKRLTGDEDNLAGFCGFLGAAAGKPLRMNGLKWIADGMKADADLGKWFRDGTSDAFMGFLDVLVSEHAVELSRDENARQALLNLVAHAVSRQLTAALALQERIRRVL